MGKFPEILRYVTQETSLVSTNLKICNSHYEALSCSRITSVCSSCESVAGSRKKTGSFLEHSELKDIRFKSRKLSISRNFHQFMTEYHTSYFGLSEKLGKMVLSNSKFSSLDFRFKSGFSHFTSDCLFAKTLMKISSLIIF